MKKTFIGLALAAMLLIGSSSHAVDVLDLIRADIEGQRVTILTQNMSFDPAEGKIFWPLYKEYRAQMSQIIRQRLAIFQEYMDNILNMNDQTANDIMERYFKSEEEAIKLKRKYYKKMIKKLSDKRVAQFFQIDNQLDVAYDFQVASKIPMIH